MLIIILVPDIVSETRQTRFCSTNSLDFEDMAPLALIHIAEDLSFNPSHVITSEECQTRSVAAGAGAFCVGFSGGVAVQAQYQRFLPKSMKALLLLPIVFGAGCATAMYRHSVERYSHRWTSTPHISHNHE